MARVLLDTDMLSEVIKKQDPRVAAHAEQYIGAERRLTVSVLSVMEITYGFHRVGREDRVHQFRSLIANHEVLAFDSAAAAIAGRVYADVERAGTPVGLADVMIAAVALQHDLPVVTGNDDHVQAIATRRVPRAEGVERTHSPAADHRAALLAAVWLSAESSALRQALGPRDGDDGGTATDRLGRVPLRVRMPDG